MNVRSIVISFLFFLGTWFSNDAWAQTVEFDEGTISVGFGTNILNKSGSPVYFTSKKSPELDFTGVEDPQIFVVFQNVKWKKEFADKGNYYFIAKSDWVKENGNLLEKSGKKTIKTKSKAKRKVYFKVKKNGKTTITINYGVMKPTDENDLGKVSKIPGKTLTKEFSIKGIGVKAPEETASKESPSGDPHSSSTKSSKEQPESPTNSTASTTNSITSTQTTIPPPTQNNVVETKEPEKKETKKPKVDRKAKDEEKLWKDAQDAGSYTMYKKYMRKFPKGKYLSKAENEITKTKIKWEFRDQREEENGQYYYKIRLSDVEDAELGAFNPNLLEASLSRNIVSVFIKSPGKQELTVSDAYGRETTIEMNPQFKILQAIFSDAGENINYEIWGGKAPYFLRLVDANTQKWVCDNNKIDLPKGETRATGSISKELWATETCLLNGTYKFEVQDRRKTEAIYPDEEFVFQGKSDGGAYLLLLALVLVPLIVIGLLFMNKKKKEKESEAYFKKHNQKKQDQKPKTQSTTTYKPEEKVKEKPPAKEPEPVAKETKEPVVEEKPEPAEEAPTKSEKTEHAEVLPVANGDKKPKINVIRKKGQQQATLVHNTDDYHRVLLEQIWHDTAISEICFSKECIFAIDDFIRKENRQGIDEDNNAVPEVGGFLLGNHAFAEEDGQYKIFLEKFVPITPEENDVYKVEFGVEAWMELDNVKDQYPDYMLLGWFHTHPGHSLFLSQPDLKIHEGFFKQNFQVAMEIDTLSENLDTGFFVRTKDGQINNTRDMKEGEDWYSWMDIEKFLRKKRVR